MPAAAPSQWPDMTSVMYMLPICRAQYVEPVYILFLLGKDCAFKRID